MKKVGTKIFIDLFSEIDLGTLKQRYVDSLCYNSLETPCTIYPIELFGFFSFFFVWSFNSFQAGFTFSSIH